VRNSKTVNVRFGSKADVTLSNFDVRFTPESGHPRARGNGPPKFRLLGWRDAAGIRIGCELQILFDRVIADRYVNQCSTLKSRDELVVFDRIDGDATVAQTQHAVISRAVSGGGVPVWM
jgi:hypothetical protein